MAQGLGGWLCSPVAAPIGLSPLNLLLCQAGIRTGGGGGYHAGGWSGRARARGHDQISRRRTAYPGDTGRAAPGNVRWRDKEPLQPARHKHTTSPASVPGGRGRGTYRGGGRRSRARFRFAGRRRGHRDVGGVSCAAG